MYKLEYIPKNVCSTKMTFIIDGNEILDATVTDGCKGGSQALCQAAITIKDIDKIIDTFGSIACGGSETKTTSCAQQFAIGLLYYKILVSGEKLSTEQESQVIKFTQIEDVFSEKERIENKQKKFYLRNIKNKF